MQAGGSHAGATYWTCHQVTPTNKVCVGPLHMALTHGVAPAHPQAKAQRRRDGGWQHAPVNMRISFWGSVTNAAHPTHGINEEEEEEWEEEEKEGEADAEGDAEMV